MTKDYKSGFRHIVLKSIFVLYNDFLRLLKFHAFNRKNAGYIKFYFCFLNVESLFFKVYHIFLYKNNFMPGMFNLIKYNNKMKNYKT